MARGHAVARDRRDHGIPSATLLALLLVGVARPTDAAGAGIVRLAATAFLAVASHLLLDVLTSFGTALLFPFSRVRYSTRSHFIADPIVLGILAAGLFTGASLSALAALGVYLAACMAVRAALLRVVARNLARAGLPSAPLVLEPRLLAPWRWLAVVTESDGYLIATLTPLGSTTISWTLASISRAARHCASPAAQAPAPASTRKCSATARHVADST